MIVQALSQGLRHFPVAGESGANGREGSRRPGIGGGVGFVSGAAEQIVTGVGVPVQPSVHRDLGEVRVTDGVEGTEAVAAVWKDGVEEGDAAGLAEEHPCMAGAVAPVPGASPGHELGIMAHLDELPPRPQCEVLTVAPQELFKGERVLPEVGVVKKLGVAHVRAPAQPVQHLVHRGYGHAALSLEVPREVALCALAIEGQRHVYGEALPRIIEGDGAQEQAGKHVAEHRHRGWVNVGGKSFLTGFVAEGFIGGA